MKAQRAYLPILLAVAVLGACQNTTVPERRDVLGSWVSSGFAPATLSMTLAETARAVDGAGAWVTPTAGYAFRVSGALAGDEVALYLDFQDRSPINFQGYFSDDDILVGTLTGAGLSQAAVTFTRVELEP